MDVREDSEGALLSTKIKTVNDQLHPKIGRFKDLFIPWSHLNKLLEYNDINFTKIIDLFGVNQRDVHI
jgi:hypothetical protein